MSSSGDDGALNDVVQRLHADLAQQAQRQLRKAYGRRADQVTLESAALVNETFIR